MSDHEIDAPSLWDRAEGLLPRTADGDYDWDALIGEPPEWYFPLVGRVAVATGGLERRFAQAALRLLDWPPDRGGELTFWLFSSTRLRTLLDAAHGLRPDFDELAKGLHRAWTLRHRVVHVATGWHDWDAPDEPSGWHYEHPRSGERVYLDAADARPALEQVLATITSLDQRVWEFYESLVQGPGQAASS